MVARRSAVAATVGLGGYAIYQLALAAGAPLGRGAWAVRRRSFRRAFASPAPPPSLSTALQPWSCYGVLASASAGSHLLSRGLARGYWSSC